MEVIKRLYPFFFILAVVFSCKTQPPQEHRYVDYQPFFDQTKKRFMPSPSVSEARLDTLVQVLSNIRPEEYNFNDSLTIVQEFDFLQGELIIDIDSINEKPPIFDTFMVVERFLLRDELVNSLFPVVPDSIKNSTNNDSLKSEVPPPVIKKVEPPKKTVKPNQKKKKYKPRKYVMPSYVRTVKGKQKYVEKRNPFRNDKPKPKPVAKPKPDVNDQLANQQTQQPAKKAPQYLTREEILADTTRDLFEADTIINSIFESTGWVVGDSIPYYEGYSAFSEDSSIKIESRMVFVEIHDTTRNVKQFPIARLNKEVKTQFKFPDKIMNTGKVMFLHFFKDEEDVFMDMVRVQGGTFKIGSNEFDEDERPEYGLRVSDFLIGKYEVTNEVFCTLLNLLRCDSLGKINRLKVINLKSDYTKIFYNQKTGRFNVYKGFEKFPVVNVTWAGANLVCKQMGGRLLSEAEWEYAAKGGIYAIRYYTDAENTDYAYEHRFAGSNLMGEVGWFVDNSSGYCHKVGALAPNRLGIFDMCGNVWEWCYDNYDKEFYKRNSDSSDPICINSNGIRINRGGSWSSDAMYCRITNRNFSDEFQYNPYLGLRLMREWKK